MKKIYAIGVGGSGSKCLESVISLHALGFYGQDAVLGVLLVDADASNGNSQRTNILLDRTIKAHDTFKNGSTQLFKGEVINYGNWNPLADVSHATNLEGIFNKPALQYQTPQLGKLFDALYSPEEQVADLGVGFRGRPPIGSIVMSRLELEIARGPGGGARNGWQRLYASVQDDLGAGNNQVIVHFFGSIFGGTGASGIPTLAKLLANQLTDQGLRTNIRINASLLLPYFGFEKPDDGNQTVYAETRFFALNTQAALQYLTEQAHGSFDRIYLIGDHDKKQYRSFTGGTNQRNDAHFVELYAGLAINHGFQNFGTHGESKGSYISRTSSERLIWDDLPDADQTWKQLSQGVKFAYAWLYNFSLELQDAKTLGSCNFAKGAPWFHYYFSLRGGKDGKPDVSSNSEVEHNKILTFWSYYFLVWIEQISTSHRGVGIWFRLPKLDATTVSKEFNPDAPRQYHERLDELVIDENRPLGCLDSIKNDLADQKLSNQFGVIGLAHNLFQLLGGSN